MTGSAQLVEKKGRGEHSEARKQNNGQARTKKRGPGGRKAKRAQYNRSRKIGKSNAHYLKTHLT